MAQIFPQWTNRLPGLTLVALGVAGGFGTFAAYWWMSPKHTDVGYAPVQPVPYSHRLHAGKEVDPTSGRPGLGMDCRYCHAYVERSPHAGVPSTQVCMNCHTQVLKDSDKLEALRASWKDGKGEAPVGWKKIHKIPDFAYFDHSAHVGVGVGENRAAVGCETCHGRIDTMQVVRQEQPLSMSWCLDCHSNPAPNLRPVEAVTTMGFTPDPAWPAKAQAIARTLFPPGSLSRARTVKPDGTEITIASAGCTGCHR